jgi:hypothetical protein
VRSGDRFGGNVSQAESAVMRIVAQALRPHLTTTLPVTTERLS